MGRLTPSEALYLWRTRQKRARLICGPGGGPDRRRMSRAEAARALGLSREDYARLEDGELPRVTAATVDAMRRCAALTDRHPALEVRARLGTVVLAPEGAETVIRDLAAALSSVLVTAAPTAPELLRLARMRSGLTADEVGAALGVHRVSVHAMEERGDPALLRWWRERGWIFPEG